MGALDIGKGQVKNIYAIAAKLGMVDRSSLSAAARAGAGVDRQNVRQGSDTFRGAGGPHGTAPTQRTSRSKEKTGAEI